MTINYRPTFFNTILTHVWFNIFLVLFHTPLKGLLTNLTPPWPNTLHLQPIGPDQGVRCNALCPGGVENGQPVDFLREVCSLSQWFNSPDGWRSLFMVINTEFTRSICL
jgi:hypothetical protein